MPLSRVSPLVRGLSGLAALATLTLAPLAHAAPTKEECVEAHGKGQDLREHGKLVEAKKTFLQCAQSSCPALVQSDCARFGDELRSLPSLSFSARDGDGHDLHDAKVYVDGELVSENLDDGKSYEMDPGKHQIRFVRGSEERVESVVVTQSDKSRNVIGTFGSPTKGTAGGGPGSTTEPPHEPETPRRSLLPFVLVGVGGAAVVTGGVLALVGHGKIPSQCSLGSHDCAAPAGDPAFHDAKTSVTLMNVGFIVGGVGLGAVAGGLVWYAVSPKKAPSQTAFTPFFDGRAGGVALAHSF